VKIKELVGTLGRARHEAGRLYEPMLNPPTYDTWHVGRRENAAGFQAIGQVAEDARAVARAHRQELSPRDLQPASAQARSAINWPHAGTTSGKATPFGHERGGSAARPCNDRQV